MEGEGSTAIQKVIPDRLKSRLVSTASERKISERVVARQLEDWGGWIEGPEVGRRETRKHSSLRVCSSVMTKRVTDEAKRSGGR